MYQGGKSMPYNIKKICAHELDLNSEAAIKTNRVISIPSTNYKVIDFFVDHIEGSINAKHTKVGKFKNVNVDVYVNCLELFNNISSDQKLIDVSGEMADSLLIEMKKIGSKSNGTLLFIIYERTELQQQYLAILKMDKNDGIQYDQQNNTFNIQEDILPGVNEKLHKCAFIKLKGDLINEDVQLWVLDKQQSKDHVSKYFMDSFLGAIPKIDDKRMTLIVDETISEFIMDNNTIPNQNDRLKFLNSMEGVLTSGNNIDLENKLEELLEPYIEGEANTSEFIEDYKAYTRQKYEDAYFQFKAEKKETLTTVTDDAKLITFRFPNRLLDRSVFIEHPEGDENVTIIKVHKKLN